MSRPPARDQQVLSGIDRVEVRLGAGRVELSGQRRSSVRLRTTTRTHWRDRPLVVRHDAGCLSIDGPRSTARVELALPPDLTVRVRLRDGDITLWGASGTLELLTQRGQVTGRDLGPEPPAAGNELAAGMSGPTTISAQASDGAINLHLRAEPGSVEATARGNVVVVLPRGSYHVDAAAGQGAPLVEVEQGAGPPLRLASRAGSVRVTPDTGPLPI